MMEKIHPDTKTRPCIGHIFMSGWRKGVQVLDEKQLGREGGC